VLLTIQLPVRVDDASCDFDCIKHGLDTTQISGGATQSIEIWQDRQTPNRSSPTLVIAFL
jgi:hypothetical protein